MEGETAAVLAAEMRAHMSADQVAFGRINQDTAEIKATLSTMMKKWDDGVERIHQRIDTEAAVSRAGLKATMEFTQEAHDRISEQTLDTEKKVNGLHIKFLVGMSTIMIAVIGWFADHFLGGRHS